LAGPRFLQLSDVAEVLNISGSQAYALVRSGELPAIKVGGRGQWRVESTVLEDYIQRCYSQTRAFVDAHPLGSRRRAAGRRRGVARPPPAAARPAQRFPPALGCRRPCRP
jgi:excisionase family DNA binding protein